MKVAAAVLTRNIYEHDRRDLFEQTVDSLKTAGVELYVVDNGSTDGTAELVAKAVDWKPYLSTDRNTTSGFGTWTCCRILAATDADLCVVSDDDMVWTSGFVPALTAWWEGAPEKLTLTGGHLEPEYFWNNVEGRAVYGHVYGLLRESTGGASWTFLRSRFDRLAKVASLIPIDRQGMWDVPMCQGVRANDWSIGQLDLAEHAGQGRSTWGNGTEGLYGWDLASVKARLP